jgi:hypothetical protein
MAKKKKQKLTTAEIMKIIIDEDLLKERKETAASAITKSTIIKEEKFIIKPKWFETQIKKSDFIIKEYENKFYARHNEWKNNIWIGAYDSEKELNDVINSYVKETKKKPMDRNIKGIKSILIEFD